MKTATITLNKAKIDKHIDAHTFKRADATLGQASEQTQNAASSDSEESLDMAIITEYRDRRDARLRSKLRFCLVDTSDTLSFSNTPMDTEPNYVYSLKVDDTVTASDIRSLGIKMDEYIERGVLHDWYLFAGLEPTDNDRTLAELEDDIAAGLRGRSYGRRPLQPFGPAVYYKEETDESDEES